MSHWIADDSSVTKSWSCRTSRDGHALPVVLGHLVGEEVHPIPRRETLLQPGVELSRGQRHGHAALDVEGDHAVEEQVVLALGDDLGLAVLGDKDRKLPQVGANEIPNAFFCSRIESEAVFKAAVGFVGGNDKILLDGASAGYLLI